MMPEPTYTIILTESERTAMAKVFGTLVTKLINAPIFVESPSAGTQVARAILAPPAPASPSAQPSGHVPPSPIELRDRWARDRKGDEAPNPEGCIAAEVTIWKTDQKEKYLRLTWSGSSGAGYSDANCFDQALWPWLIKQTGQITRLYLVHKGKYTNIVGVRA